MIEHMAIRNAINTSEDTNKFQFPHSIEFTNDIDEKINNVSSAKTTFWVNAHVDIGYNKKVDALAKESWQNR